MSPAVRSQASARSSTPTSWRTSGQSPTSDRYCGLRDDWFRELTDKNIRRGSFSSVPDLIASIEDYPRVTNANPKPLIWTPLAPLFTSCLEGLFSETLIKLCESLSSRVRAEHYFAPC